MNVALLRGRSIVQLLREQLARAEAGELAGIVVVYETTDELVGHSMAFRQGVSLNSLVGELHLAMIGLHIEGGRLEAPTPKE